MKKILVADDSMTIVRIASLALKFRGYIVEAVNNGKDAWQALKEEKFDMAIIDLIMPVMDGCELLARIRNDDRTKDIPTVILTEADNEKLRTRVQALGADYFITKPFQSRELIETVEVLLDEKHV